MHSGWHIFLMATIEVNHIQSLVRSLWATHLDRTPIVMPYIRKDIPYGTGLACDVMYPGFCISSFRL